MIMDVEAREIEEGDFIIDCLEVKKVMKAENGTIEFVLSNGKSLCLPAGRTVIISTDKVNGE